MTPRTKSRENMEKVEEEMEDANEIHAASKPQV